MSNDPGPDAAPLDALRCKKRHRLNAVLAGIPELDYFESDEKRETALVQASKEARRTALSFWILVSSLAFANIVITLFVAWLAHLMSWSTYVEKGVQSAFYLVTMIILMRKWNRYRFPKLLRKKLIEQGVPMCLKCGYNLRGLEAETTRCPECGAAINEDSKKILDGRSSSKSSATNEEPFINL